MGDTGPVVTAEANGFTVTTNSGISESQLRSNLKPIADKGASEAARELGKRGGAAAAKAREEKPEPEPEKKPEKVEAKAEPEPESVEKPEPEKAEPEAKEAKPEGEEEKSEEKPPEKDKKGDPRHDPRARMLEATRQAAEAKRARDAEKARADAAEARLAALERGEKPKAEPEPVKSNGKPSPADFESYEDYLDARDAYNRDQWERSVQERAQAEAFDRAFDAHAAKFREAALPHAEKYSEEVLTLKTSLQHYTDSPGQPFSASNWIADYLFANTEAAPTLMLHLSEHSDDLQRIAALSNEHAVSREMAKLEARLEAAPAGDSPKREDVSKAAPPVRPVTGKPYVTESDGYKEGMSLDEYARIWRKQNARR